jgi:F0F1-type ATP synthase assembly protein I
MIEPTPPGQSPWRQLAIVLSAGLTFALAVVIGIVGGHWLDGKLGTKVLFTFLGGALGLWAGLKEIIRELKKMDRQ